MTQESVNHADKMYVAEVNGELIRVKYGEKNTKHFLVNAAK